MILGSSLVRNVTIPGAKTMSYPGTRVNYITKLLPNVLRQDMEIDSIVVHVGFNDIMKGSSEKLKLDFKELIDSLLKTNKRPIIFGPLPSLNCGIEHFSRILSFHNWLRDYCSSMCVTFADNSIPFGNKTHFMRWMESIQSI